MTRFILLTVYLFLISFNTQADTVSPLPTATQAMNQCSTLTFNCAQYGENGESISGGIGCSQDTANKVVNAIAHCYKTFQPGISVFGPSTVSSIPYSDTGGCPAGGYTYENGSCVRPDCSTGNINDSTTGQCVPDCNHPSRNLQGQTYGGSGNFSNSLCVAGCSYNVSGGYQGCKNGVCNFGATVGKATGSACNPQENPPVSEDNLTPEQKCTANGQGYVSVNGVVSCVGSGTAGGGDVTDYDSGSPTNPTFQDGGGVDTNNDGDADMSKEEFCSQNPASSQCNSSFGGACGGNFNCDGDSVQCAIALNQHKLDCDNRATNAQSVLGDAIIAGVVETDNPLSDANSQVINLPTQLTATSLLSHAGFSDISFPVGSTSVNLPLSKLNGGLNAVGIIVEIFAYLTGMFIVFGRRG